MAKREKTITIIDKMLGCYHAARLQTQKKARALLYTCLIIALADILFTSGMLITGAQLVTIVGLCFFLCCLVMILLICCNHYYLASNIFLFLLFCAMFIAIKFDLYQDVYETYVFATLGLVLLIIASLVGYTRLQMYIIILLDIIAIVVIYVLDVLPSAPRPLPELHLQNLITSIIMVILGGSAGIILITSQRTLLASVEKEKEETRRMFKITEVYTKKSLISIIADGKDPTKFLPVGREIAVLFSDIRDFTAFSENMKPIDIISFLNSFFNRMNGIIQQKKGEIDKLIGDGIMASFIIPGNALQAAWAMKKELQEHNKDRTSWGQQPLRTGIGIAYGAVIIGNIGSLSKMDYTVIGDVVNASSRLEALTRHYGVDIITSEECVPFIEPGTAYRFLDVVRVKGRSRSIDIYEIFEHEPDWIKTLKLRLLPRLQAAFALYGRGEFLKAREQYLALIKEVGPHRYLKGFCADPVLDFFRKRCSSLYRLEKRGLFNKQKWDGIYAFEIK